MGVDTWWLPTMRTTARMEIHKSMKVPASRHVGKSKWHSNPDPGRIQKHNPQFWILMLLWCR